MKTNVIYFYTVRSKNENTNVEQYEVIKVNQFNNDTDFAERKARTIATKHGTELAGGYFHETRKPYNFATNYTVINCADNTKIQPYNSRDLFIIDLIERESNAEFVIL